MSKIRGTKTYNSSSEKKYLSLWTDSIYVCTYKDVLTILVSIFHVLRDERKVIEFASYLKGEKGEGHYDEAGF